MQHIETIELGSSQSSITFSSIPQDYDDLVFKVSLRGARSNVDENLVFTINGATTNYSSVRLAGNGSSASSANDTFGPNALFGGFMPAANATANTFSNSSYYFSNYTASQAKSISFDSVSEDNATAGFQNIVAALWNDTSAITSVTFKTLGGENLVAGSTISLYGITAGGDGTVTTS